MKTLILISVILLSIPTIFATVGVDVSQYVSESDWSCLRQPGGQGAVDFAVVRVYMSSGEVDPNGAQTIINARNAGVSYVDGYIFPCYGCGNPGGQVQAAVSNLQSSGAQFGMIWYDIEIYAWSGDQGANQNFIQGLIDEGKNLGINAGIYTSYNNWQSIVGIDWSYPADNGIQLWYADWDGSQSWSGFTPFGGWSSPSIKQYLGNDSSCGVGVDYDFY